jgi:hypothetical protein
MSPPEGPRLKIIGKPKWKDARTFVIPIMLQPATTYRPGINSGKTKRFVSAGDGTPAVPFEFSFSTAGAKKPAAAVTEQEKAKALKVPLPGKGGPVQLRYDYRTGDVGRVMQRNVVDIKLKLSNGQTFPIVNKGGINSIEEVLAVADGKPVEVRKLISEFLLIASSEETGELQAAPKLDKGVEVKVDRRGDTPRPEVVSGQAPQELLALLAEDYFPDVVPPLSIKVGQTFGLPAETIGYLRAEFGSTANDRVDVKLTCRRIGPKRIADARNKMLQSQGKQPVTYDLNVAEIDVDWTQDGRLPNNIQFTLTAKGKMIFAVDAGVLLKFGVDGKFVTKPIQTQDNSGQPVTVTGDGVYAYKYDYDPINWTRGVATGATPGTTPPGPKTDSTKTDAKPSSDPLAEARTEALTTPKGSIVHQYNMLNLGQVELLKKCFTPRVRDKITPEAVKQGKEAIKEYGLNELVAEVLVDEEKGMCKIKMSNGRTLTWLVKTSGQWLSDNIWFK